MPIFSHREFDHHEQIMYCHDEATGLFGIIAVHSTALGPAAGGCRMYPYASADDALTDVLRLARGMSYKNAIANLPLGGGKSVIVADPARPDKADLLRAFSRHVQALGGRYWTAIDVGVGPQDADVLAENCDYIFARASQYPDGFNASLFTAFGGFVGIQAVVNYLWKRQDLAGLRVAIQGLGATGRDLARQLHEVGAQLVVADLDDEAVRHVVENYGAQVVDPSRIHAQDVDVFAPCAMGAVINDATVPEIIAKAICGLANNQLAESRHGAALRARGIAYVPDYVVNGGGIAAAGQMIYSKPTREAQKQSILRLRDTIPAILAQADAEKRSSADVADDMARARIAAGRSQREKKHG
jgi:leucine dehydrogenase